jgi:hypothetical protein
MKYTVTFNTSRDIWQIQHFDVESPEAAAVAEQEYVWNECMRDESIEYMLKCINSGEPNSEELLVLGEDGSSWIVKVDLWPTFDMRRPEKERTRWFGAATECAKTDVRSRWHKFSAAEKEEFDEGAKQDESVHHICGSDPCQQCAELDAGTA